MTPDSDREMDRLLGAVLPGTLAPASAECLDAERLAAWSEGALDPQDARSVEAHLAGCARCQSLAAVFARTEPAPAASASPGVVIPMRRRWPMGWIAPLAAAAAAVTLWIAWPGHEPTSSITSAPAVAPPSQTMARAEENKQMAAEATAPAAGSFAESKNQARVQAPADADASRLDQMKKDAASAAGKRERDVAVNPTAAPVEAPATIAPTPPPPPPAPAAPPFAQSGQAGVARRAEPPLGAMNEAVTVARPELQAQDRAAAAKLETTVPPVIEIVTVPPPLMLDAISQAEPRQAANPAAGGGVAGGVAAGRGGAGGGRGGGARAAQPAQTPAAAPASAPRWRILEGTRVERSTDNGATWLPLGIDLPARLTGGASPAPSVCWLIGERGLILLSTNGLNFERITFPAAVNLTGIRATSAQSASVATSDGRTFITSDGGQSWRLQGFPAGSF